MLEFLTTYWRELIVCLCAIISLFVTLFKSRSKIFFERSHIDVLLSLINEAEALYKDGSLKMQYVLSKFKEEYPIFYSQLEETAKKGDFWNKVTADQLITNMVEYILTTPQKKSR